MKIIITGGGGFLGSQLATTLLEHGRLTGPSGGQEPIEEIILIDARFVTPQNDPRMQQIVGDISNRDVINEATPLYTSDAAAHSVRSDTG